MDDDDIFNSITGGSTVTQPVQPASQPLMQPVQNNDDPFGLMGLSVGGNTQTTPVQPINTGF